MSIGETIKELAMKIPGYRGYAEKEERRSADKELREATAAAFSSQVIRISRLQEQMVERGEFDSLELLDRAITRLQHLADRIRTATYGFGGFFDLNQVDDAALERLYSFDLALTKGVEQLGDLIAQVGQYTSTSTAVAALRDKIDDLHATFDQRSQLLLDPSHALGGGSTPPSLPGESPVNP